MMMKKTLAAICFSLLTATTAAQAAPAAPAAPLSAADLAATDTPAAAPTPEGEAAPAAKDEAAPALAMPGKDATPEEKAIREINTGIMAIPSARLADWLGRLSNSNAQGEYYLTDIVALAVGEGLPVRTVHPDREWEVLGVNSKVQLAGLERVHQRYLADAMLVGGVRLADPERIDRKRACCQRAPKSPQLWAFKIPWPAGSVRIGDQPAV